MIRERIPTIKIIDLYRIPLVAIANLAEVEPQRVSDYVAHRAVNRQRLAAIESAVKQIETVITALDPLKINISDPASVKLALQSIGAYQGQVLGEMDRAIKQLAAETVETLKS